MRKTLILAAAAALTLPTLAQAKPEGFYAGAHAGTSETPQRNSLTGLGFNLGYQFANGWGLHGEATKGSRSSGFGGVFGTYRSSGTVYFLAKGGVAGGRDANGPAGGVGIGFDLSESVNLEGDINRYGDANVAHLRLSYSF